MCIIMIIITGYTCMLYCMAITICMHAVHMLCGIGFPVSLISCMCVYISVIIVLISTRSVCLYTRDIKLFSSTNASATPRG